ncbi:MAG TPA: ECF transporter S component [Candidatus Limnocylindrales bacterium]|jgi:energy-coupling factor transport system substrate-specific component
MSTDISAGGVSESARWRTVDIVVVALLSTAFGVVFFIWNNYVWVWASGAGYQAASLVTGAWLLPAVVCPLVVRKPGAALFGEMVAAFVAMLLGNAWGMDSLLSGVLQGTGAELVFAFALYRRWGPIAAVLASVGAGIGEAIHDTTISYAAYDVPYRAVIAGAEILSAVLIAGIGSWLLVRGLRRTGALDAFSVGE